MADDKKKTGLYVDIEPALKFELERIAFERSSPGKRVALRSIVIEALEAFVAHHSGPQGHQGGAGDESAG